MGPDKLIAGGGSGWMGGAGDEAGTDYVYERPTARHRNDVALPTLFAMYSQLSCLKKNQNAPIPSEHPPVRRKNVKTFRWDQRLQIQNLFMAIKRVPLW